MICSQCHASAALQPLLIGLQLGDALSDVNVAFGLLVGNVEVLDVQMTRAIASTLASIGLKQHGTYVVLIEDILLDWISLSLEKQLCPYHWRDDFISGYHFCFSRTSCVHTLLPAEGSNGSITHCKG